MPQGLGKNLYLELSVHDNVDFMAQLFGLAAAERRVRVKELLDATGLGPFADRPAGKLSGGMKQKVGLCGALVHEPDLLILDEPTTGVDPLSRRQFWTLIDDIRAGRPGMSVVISTAYMDEAQQWDWIVAMDAGRVLATGTPAELMERTGTHDLEQCFIALLARGEAQGPHRARRSRRARPAKPEIAIEAHGPDAPLRQLHRRRPRHAVDRARRDLRLPRLERLRQVDDDEDADRPAAAHRRDRDALRQLRRGRQHGGAQEPRLHDAGVLALRRADASARTWSCTRASITCRRTRRRRASRSWSRRSACGAHLDALAEALPMGLRQRLSLAVAVLHEPQILILDEPTSGVDPVARDSFWELLIDLSRKQGVTIFVTTHFMNEGMRCDRISLMNAGKVLACDAPQKLIEARGAAEPRGRLHRLHGGLRSPTRRRAHGAKASRRRRSRAPPPSRLPLSPRRSSSPLQLRLGRMLAYAHNETMQILRDPVRLAFAFVGSALLMLVFGFGITTDVEHIRYASLDLDQSPESRPISSSSPARARYFTHDAGRPLRRRSAASACSRTTSRWSSRFRPASAGTFAAAPGPRCSRRSTAP